MNWKQKYIERLKRKTVISELNGEKVYLSKGSFISWLPFGIGKYMKEWSQIYPAVDEETMEVNWTNFIIGGVRNLVKLGLVAFVIVLVFLQFKTNFSVIEYYREVCEPILNLKIMP